MLKLPSAFVCGVRVKVITTNSCRVSVAHNWLNSNPFRSMYFAVQLMAAELSTGALVMKYIRESGNDISMLVASNSAIYMKKATGRIEFDCHDGNLISDTIRLASTFSGPQTCTLISVGTNEDGEVVSEMKFEWTLRRRAAR